MKKLYRKSTVHPTPSVISEQLLSFLPAAILTLTAALSPLDREVLAYLISCSSSAANFTNTRRKTAPRTSGGASKSSSDDHSPSFNCNCFRCYMSYWIKWDSSPNRQLIHEIIDAFEDSLLKESKREKNKRERRKGKNVKSNVAAGNLLDDEVKSAEISLIKEDFEFVESTTEAEGGSCFCGGGGENDYNNNNEEEEEEEMERGSVRKIVSFLWSVWG